MFKKITILVILFSFLFVGRPSAITAQDSESTVRLVVVTGTDGTENPLLVELYGEDNPPMALWRTVVAEDADDLQPGQTSTFEFTVPADFCDLTGFWMFKPADSAHGDDPWDIREYHVYVNDIELSFDTVVYQRFSPLTATSLPVNSSWVETAAYQSECVASSETAGESSSVILHLTEPDSLENMELYLVVASEEDPVPVTLGEPDENGDYHFDMPYSFCDITGYRWKNRVEDQWRVDFVRVTINGERVYQIEDLMVGALTTLTFGWNNSDPYTEQCPE